MFFVVVEDQRVVLVRLCLAIVNREGWEVVSVRRGGGAVVG